MLWLFHMGLFPSFIHCWACPACWGRRGQSLGHPISSLSDRRCQVHQEHPSVSLFSQDTWSLLHPGGTKVVPKTKLKRKERKSSGDPHHKILTHKFHQSWGDADEVFHIFNKHWHFRLFWSLLQKSVHTVDNNYTQLEFHEGSVYQGMENCWSVHGKLVYLSQRCQSQSFYVLNDGNGWRATIQHTWSGSRHSLHKHHHFLMLLPLNLSHDFRTQPWISAVAL